LEIKLEVENEDAGTTLTAIPLLQTFVCAPPPTLSSTELSKVTSLPMTLKRAICAGIPELDPANRDDLLPAYLAFRMGKLAGTSSF
jgi:hypothetical protein